MSEFVSRDAALAVACPTCGAGAGETCRGVQRQDGHRRDRTSLHADRHLLASKVAQDGPRERRYYDDELAETSDAMVEIDGKVGYVIPERARSLGLREVERIRAQLAEHGRNRRGGVSGQATAEEATQTAFAEAAKRRAAEWHAAGSPNPVGWRPAEQPALELEQ